MHRGLHHGNVKVQEATRQAQRTMRTQGEVPDVRDVGDLANALIDKIDAPGKLGATRSEQLRNLRSGLSHMMANSLLSIHRRKPRGRLTKSGMSAHITRRPPTQRRNGRRSSYAF